MTTKISDLETVLAGVVAGVSELPSEDLVRAHGLIERALLHVVLEKHLRSGVYLVRGAAQGGHGSTVV